MRFPTSANLLLLKPDWQQGQGMVEYSLILVLIGVVVLVLLISTGHVVTSLFSNVSAKLHDAGI